MDNEEIRKKIWRISDGIPFKIGTMTIRTTDSGKLLVIGWTDTVYFENISKVKTLRELDELKLLFSDLRESFYELNDIIKLNDLIIEYHMQYNEGKGAIGLCSEIDGKIDWYISNIK